MESFEAALKSVNRYTEKYTSFAPVYDQILRELPSDPVIVEIGIANGGSLEMWRGIFGHGARIIGVDLVIEDIHSAFMRDFANPSRWSSWSYLSRLIADVHRLHPRSQTPAQLPGISADIESVVIAGGIVSFRKYVGYALQTSAISGGEDSSLMDFDHRWDSMSGARGRLDRAITSPLVASTKFGRYVAQIVTAGRVKRRSRAAIRDALQDQR